MLWSFARGLEVDQRPAWRGSYDPHAGEVKQHHVVVECAVDGVAGFDRTVGTRTEG